MADDDTWTLTLAQAVNQRWTFALHFDLEDPAAYIDMNEWTPYSEIRTKEREGDLVVSLSSFFTAVDGLEDEDDAGSAAVPGKYLVLDIPGAATAGIELPLRDGWFDIFLVNIADPGIPMLLTEAAVEFNPMTTDMSEVEA